MFVVPQFTAIHRNSSIEVTHQSPQWWCKASKIRPQSSLFQGEGDQMTRRFSVQTLANSIESRLQIKRRISEWRSLSNWSLSRQIPQGRNASTIDAGLWRKATRQNVKSSAHCSAKHRNSFEVCLQKQLTSVLEEWFKIQPKFEASSSHGKPTRWLADSQYKSPAKSLNSIESSQQEQLKFEVRNPCLPKADGVELSVHYSTNHRNWVEVTHQKQLMSFIVEL